jgi:hypothetical protein
MAFDKNEWMPNIKQEPFLAIPTSIFEAGYLGGAGSGKSDVLLMYGICHGWHENSKFKQLFTRRTFPELRNEIVPRSRQIYPKFGATFNKGDMAWTFPRADQYGSGYVNDGAMIFLGHCEDEKDVHKYDSMEINLFTPDEITSYTEYIYLYIAFTRVRTSSPELPAIVRVAGMPGGVGHTWVKKRFINPCKEGGKIIIGKGGIKRMMITATLADNAEHIDPNYKNTLEALPEAEKRAKKYGDWDSYLGQVFDEFRDKQYPGEPDNALHVVEPFDIPEWWLKIYIGDWGFAAMTWVAHAAISPNRRVIVYKESHWTKTKIEEWGPILKVDIERDNPRLIKFCKSVGRELGQEHTIQEQISQAIGRPVELTNHAAGSRISGKQLIHEYLRWKPKPVIPLADMVPYSEEQAMWLLRNRGPVEYKAYLNSFMPQEEETNLPKLLIFNTCPVLIDAIKACTYDKPKNGKPAEDIAEFEGDDPIDGLRYLVDAADQFFETANDEFKKVKKQEEYVNLFNREKDWTAFYRNMRTVEASESQGVKMIRYRRH